MSHTTKIVTFLIVTILVTGGITYVTTSMKGETRIASTTTPAIDYGSDFDGDGIDEPGFESANELADMPRSYTMTEIAAHATAADCWTAIRGNVYNLTSFVAKHPGGKGIVRVCGKDGTAIFSDQHGGSQPQENTLASFQIGIVKK